MAKDIRPEDAFADMVVQWERMSNDFANQLMGKKEFSKGMSTATKFSLQMRKLIHDQMTGILELHNLPSRDDVIELSCLVSEMNTRLDRIENKIDGGSEVLKPARNVLRTKRPKSSSPEPDA